MAFQKGKPRPPLKVKTCAICRKSFQPSSGAQKICGEPECKARSRMQKYLDKKASNKKDEDYQDETREERLARIDRENPIPQKRKNYRSEGNGSDVPDLELDLSPLAAYIRAMIDQAMSQREMKDFIREVVREEIASRLKPLFGMG